MATTQRDYYEVLGVARGADDGEIKRAFRRLARELHPDVSEAPDAQERFREVVEAYEVLWMRETRELYDRVGHAGVRGDGRTRCPARRAGVTGAASRGERSRSRSRPISTPASESGSPARGMRAGGAARAAATFTSRCGSAPAHASCSRATTSFRPST